MVDKEDATALAELPQPETMLTYASILEKPKYQIDEKTGARYLLATGEIVEAACAALRVCAALRATSQTPDAVREALAELIANRDGNTLGESRGINIADHDKEKYRKFADRILKLVASRSTPSASAGPQAEAVREILEADAQPVEAYFDNAEDMLKWLNSDLPEFEDARVKIVYGLLCSNIMPPNPEEHWEGYLSRCIVAALYAHPQPQQADGRGAVIEAVRLLQKISDLAFDEDVGEPLDCAIDYANKALAALQQSPATKD